MRDVGREKTLRQVYTPLVSLRGSDGSVLAGLIGLMKQRSVATALED